MKGHAPVFVSSHFRVNESELRSFLQRQGLTFRPTGDELCVRDCPFCHDTKGRADNLWKLYVTRESGAYFCHRCGNKGSWFDLQRAFGVRVEISDARNQQVGARAVKPKKRPNQSVVKAFPAGLNIMPEVMDYLAARSLTAETVEHFKVGAANYQMFDKETGEMVEHTCVTFPWFEKNKKGEDEIIRVKGRSITDKRMMTLDPAGGAWGFFGWHAIPDEAQEIVLTEGEFDAMAVWQETRAHVVSLPNGSRSLPEELIEKLERFETIILWLDDDVPGQDAVKSFSKKLGIERCRVIETRQGKADGPKDANDALKAGVSLTELLMSAKPIPHEQILTTSDLKSDIFREIANPKQTAGIPWDSLPKLNEILKGFRTGELTILTGPSGAGKTTVLGQLSVDLASRGVHTLWGSFEIKNERLAKKMFMQHAGLPGDKLLEKFDLYFDRFASLPFWFMRYFGATSVENALEAMKYAVYALDVKHVIIDNLQFMTAGDARRGNKFDVQDDAIFQFRNFASDNNIHITLVIHPKKIADFAEIDASGLGGTAKAHQECDNFIVLQKTPDYKYLDVRKNRFDGDLGRVPYGYDKETGRIYELTEEQYTVLQQKGVIGDTTGYKTQNSNITSESTAKGSKRKMSSSKFKNPPYYSPGADNE